jgi:hypothetical protein
MSVIKLIAAGFLLGVSGFAQSENASISVNCTAGDSLQAAINAAAPNTTLDLKGVCTGPVVIATDGLKLRGASTASINGAKQDAVTINGARRIMIAGLTVTGGNNGIVAGNGAQILLQNTTVTGNGDRQRADGPSIGIKFGSHGHWRRDQRQWSERGGCRKYVFADRDRDLFDYRQRGFRHQH